MLLIESGRYTKPKTLRENRLCHTCNIVEDEWHFVIECKETEVNRTILYTKIAQVDVSFRDLPECGKFTYLMKCIDRNILTWFGKFLHNSFKARKKLES